MWRETLWSVFRDIIEESKFTIYNINKLLRLNIFDVIACFSLPLDKYKELLLLPIEKKKIT